jgi:broad-specificity NMP kinase
MILWLNGTFGVGKTTTARAIQQAEPGWRLFDPETVGYMLTANLRDQEIHDFQDLAAWRSFVPQVAARLVQHTGADLIATQTVLTEPYWIELTGGATAVGLEVFHVLLDCDETALRERIRADEVERGAEGWRIEHLTVYAQARPWLVRAADAVIDTSTISPETVAARVLSALR